MITDRAGHAKDLVPALHDEASSVATPRTRAAVFGNRMYFHYVSIKTQGPVPFSTLGLQ